MISVLLTGGAGFIGSHLCEKLLAEGNEVTCLDNYFTGSKQNIKHLLDNPRNVLGNIEVLIQNKNDEWEKVGEVGETGPIATDIKIVPLTKVSGWVKDNSSINIKLRMAKGLWRIDYVALAELKDNIKPIIIPPSTSSPRYSGSSNVVELLTNPDSVRVSS